MLIKDKLTRKEYEVYLEFLEDNKMAGMICLNYMRWKKLITLGKCSEAGGLLELRTSGSPTDEETFDDDSKYCQLQRKV